MGDRPLIAVVIDDLGIDKPRTAATIRLKPPLTLSFMTYASDLPSQTEAARHAGHELFLHVPMEARDPHADPGPHGLFTRLSADEILERLRWDLGRFDGFVGINNHMGSKSPRMRRRWRRSCRSCAYAVWLFSIRARRPSSTGIRLAEQYGVPHVARDVFLDDEISAPAIARQLAAVEQIARRNGSAIAIGHPHDQTRAALAAWLPQLEAKGFALVPVSTVLRHRLTEAAARAEAAELTGFDRLSLAPGPLARFARAFSPRRSAEFGAGSCGLPTPPHQARRRPAPPVIQQGSERVRAPSAASRSQP